MRRARARARAASWPCTIGHRGTQRGAPRTCEHGARRSLHAARSTCLDSPMNDVLTLILGGGRGTRLFPLTHMRSKPAVPIGGKYRLIDIPISNCLHAGLKRIFVLTQFNSASLNRHVAQTYRLDLFSDGFVEVLAAEQTPESSDWFQGTADAVRQAARHFAGYDADYYPDPRRRSPLSHGLLRADRVAHRGPRRHHHRGAAGRRRRRHRRWASSGSTIDGQIAGFEEKPNAARLAEMRQQHAARLDRRRHDRRTSRSSPRWASTCSRARCCSRSLEAAGHRLRQGDHPEGARHAPRARRTSIAATGPTSAPSTRSTTPTSS